MDQHSTTSHRLAPLLTPRSVALIGASPKPGTVGRGMITSTSMPGTPSRIHLVNPNYPEIDGKRCLSVVGRGCRSGSTWRCSASPMRGSKRR